MTPPKSNKRFFTPSNFGFFIEIFCKVSASREKNRASREKNEACFDFSEAQPVLSKIKLVPQRHRVAVHAALVALPRTQSGEI